MLRIEKRNKLKIVIDLLWIILWGGFAAISIISIPMFIFDTKWNSIGGFILALLIIMLATIIFSWMVYQLVTKIIAENFKIEFWNGYFTIKSTFIKRTVRFDDIESIYVITRGLRYTKGSMDLLKIRTKSNKKIYISLNVLDKKEEKELRRILKEGIGKKVREKVSFWE